jgi:hypothetical protein
VRLAGGAILALVPLALALSHWATGAIAHPERARQLSIAIGNRPFDSATHQPSSQHWTMPDLELSISPPSVLLSIENAGTGAESDPETPVVFPGYLLPDDNHEEAAHGGS